VVEAGFAHEAEAVGAVILVVGYVLEPRLGIGGTARKPILASRIPIGNLRIGTIVSKLWLTRAGPSKAFHVLAIAHPDALSYEMNWR